MTTYYNAKRGRWMFDFQARGKRHAGYAVHPDTGKPATTKRAADQIESLVRARALAAPEPPQPRRTTGGGCTLAEALAHYAEHVGRRRDTWPGIRLAIRELLDWFGPETVVENLTIGEVRRYTTWSLEQPVMRNVGGRQKVLRPGGHTRSISTVNGRLAVLRAAFNLAVKDEVAGGAPAVPRVKRPTDIPNPISRADLERLLAAAEPHLQTAITLCALAGFRLQECLGLTWGQVAEDYAGATLAARSTKADRGRFVPFNAALRALLARLDEERPEPRTPDQRVVLYRHRGKGAARPVRSIRNSWRAALAAAGLSGRHRFHDTRAAFCTMLAAQGVDPVHIRDLAGHQSIQTTMRYVQASRPRLREAVEALGAFGGSFGTPGPKKPHSSGQAPEKA